MKNEEILRRTEESIKELFEVIKRNPRSYGREADIHFELYFLLSHNNYDTLWKTGCIEPECDEIEEGEIDIVIYDPDLNEERMAIAIEIKVDRDENKCVFEGFLEKKPVKVDGSKYGSVEWDFHKLSKIKEKFKDIILIFIYVKNVREIAKQSRVLSMDIEDVKKKINSYRTMYGEDIRTYILNIDKKTFENY